MVTNVNVDAVKHQKATGNTMTQSKKEDCDCEELTVDIHKFDIGTCKNCGKRFRCIKSNMGWNIKWEEL